MSESTSLEFFAWPYLAAKDFQTKRRFARLVMMTVAVISKPRIEQRKGCVNIRVEEYFETSLALLIS